MTHCNDDWFNQYLFEMLTYAREHLLYKGLTGGVSADELFELTDVIEKFKDVKADGHIGSEVAHACAAEAVAERDQVLIDRLINDAVCGEHVELAMDDIMAGNIAYKMINSLPAVGENDYQFYITNPLLISVLQSTPSSNFQPVEEGAFRGPNNSMLVGNVNGVDIFSFISSADASYNQGMGTIIVGRYDKEEETFTTSIITAGDSSQP